MSTVAVFDPLFLTARLQNKLVYLSMQYAVCYDIDPQH